MKKRWIVCYSDYSEKEVKNQSEAITELRFVKNALTASFTTAKLNSKKGNIPIHINKRMALESAFICAGEYRLPENVKYGREWF